jgi:3-deoxy-D-manno-octulosonate 8-phosphate phosphatase (KDO 8-P phosphatase)
MTAGLSAIELLVLDVDGILTDGRLYVGLDGSELKAFSIVDGAGLKLLADAGIKAAIISGHASPAADHRFRRLGVTDILVGVEQKGAAFDALLEHHGLGREQTAVMGDDLMDLPLFLRAGFRATVPGAHPEILQLADYVTERPGGRGAVREVVEMILKARGLYDALLARFRA